MEDDLQTAVEFVPDPEADELLVKVSPNEVSQAVVSSTDWTTQTILVQLEQGNIALNPRFQRRDAWTKARKSKFVESLMVGLPVPQIVLAERREARGKYIVLDGKQRLLSLMQFTGRSEGKNNAFRLSDLEIRQDLEKKGFAELSANSLFRDDLDAFHNQTIRSVVIRNWPNIDFLHTVFLRLNTGSVSLSPQELRQALFPGEFSDYVDSAAADSAALKLLLGNSEPDFRMRDVELLVRFLSFAFMIEDYAGDLKQFLDMTSKEMNERWAENEPAIKQSITEFDAAVDAGRQIFGESGVGRKWSGGVFQPRLNRAVLDVITFYFAQPSIRQLALEKAPQVMVAFQELSDKDPVFRNSIETTTKSLTATYERLRRWGEALQAALQTSIPLPVFDGQRIVVKDAHRLK